MADQHNKIEEFLKSEIASPPREPFDKDMTPDILKKIAEQEGIKKRSLVIFRLTAAFFVLVAFSLGVYYALMDSLGERVVSLDDAASKSDVYVFPETKEASKWLLHAQEKTGQWDAQKWGGHKDYTVGLTGLSLMALQESGEDGVSQEAINKAVHYLLKSQNDQGLFGVRCTGAFYNHAIATLALLETYAYEKNSVVKLALDQSIDFIVTHQDTSGGWGYFDRSQKHVNTSLTVWQVNALVMAQALGWPHLSQPIKKAQKWLEVMIDTTGRAAYNQEEGFPNGYEAVTAMANYCLKLIDHKRPHSQTVMSLAQDSPRQLNFYRDFFVTLAAQCEQQEVDHLKSSIARAQIKGGRYKGSWYPDRTWGAAGGRVYATAMAVLSLQAENRARRTMELVAFNQ